jgi:hypothetical protein
MGGMQREKGIMEAIEGEVLKNSPSNVVNRNPLRYKDKLMNRNAAETGIRYEWYALQRFASEYSEEFDKPKIAYPDVCERPEFALDETGWYLNKTCFMITVPDKYLLGILNSALIHFIIKWIIPELQGGFYTLGRIYIETFPVRIIDHTDPTDVVRHDRMVSLVDQILSLQNQLTEGRTPHEQTTLQRQIEATDRQIDALVYELYGLTEEEIAVVEGRGSE